MRIILLHGDDETRSRGRLQKFIETAKSRAWDVVYVDDSPLSFTEALSVSPLFPKERFFILRDVKKIGKKEIDWLKKKNKELAGNLVIYHLGYVPAVLIKSLPEPLKVEEFKLPKLIFEFLDSLLPKKAKRAIELFHQVVKNQPPEFVFSLLAKHLRDLYWAKIIESPPPGQSPSLRAKGSEPVAGLVPYPNWRVGKLKGQAEKFEVTKLRELLSYLAKIDIEVKTSKAEIIPSLDVLLATRLE